MESPASNKSEVKTDVNETLAEDTSLFDASCRARKTRSNSVIDSVGSGERLLFVFPETNTTLWNKSLSVSDISSDEHQYSAISGSGEIFPTKSVAKLYDTTDAHVKIVAEDDDDSIISRPSTPIARMPVIKDAGCYNMNHKNRGKCVIFNHEEFDMEFEKREGSTTDANRLRDSFGRLGFDVNIHKNFTHMEVMETVEKLRKLDHTDNDCICIIVLTHGLQNDLICAKDAAYKSDKIWKPFTGDRCITLAGKPKLFFFQACRGDEVDSGVVLSPRSSMSSTDSITSYKIPTHADFLIAHSSAQNFFTWRNPAEGTWYVQCLCNVLDEYGQELDLMTMLTITARKVATDYTSYDSSDMTRHNKKQVPSVTSLLLRSIYFPPKSN